MLLSLSSHAAGLVPANYGIMNHVLQYVLCMTTAADVLALARMEIKLDSIPEGTNLVVKWRNKPLFIRHRTPEQIARMEAVSMDDLRDKEPDSQRVQRPEWLIILGICSHLGMSLFMCSNIYIYIRLYLLSGVFFL